MPFSFVSLLVPSLFLSSSWINTKKMSFSTLLVAALFIHSLPNVLASNIPRETSIYESAPDAQGWTPRPTEAPKVDLREIAKRDYLANAADYVLIAPDQTCGYVSGLAGMYIKPD
jgi:hypothetical protein